jgi:hypothetical protein
MTLFRGRRQLIGWTMDIGRRPTARRRDANIIDVAGHTTLKEQRQIYRESEDLLEIDVHRILSARVVDPNSTHHDGGLDRQANE